MDWLVVPNEGVSVFPLGPVVFGAAESPKLTFPRAVFRRWMGSDFW